MSMIDKKELMIGNNINYKGEIQQVKELHLFKLSTSWFDIEYELCDPIKLSPELLTSLGADTVTENEDWSQNYWSRNNDFSIDVETRILVPKLEMLFYYRIDGGLRGRRLPIISIHQLQNLHFALTGQELILKP